MAKKDDWSKYAILTVLVVIAFILLNNKSTTQSVMVINNTIIEKLTNPPANQGQQCVLSFSKTTIATNEQTTGTIYDGANTHCGIYYKFNNGAWQFLASVNTDATGHFSQSRTVGVAGTYMFAVLCGNCVTNMVTVTVTPTTSPDSDGDGYPDSDETNQGTNPNDPNDYPGHHNTVTYTCGTAGLNCGGTCPSDYSTCGEVYFGLYTSACVCINEQSQAVAPDWKPGAANYHPVTEDTCTEDCISYGQPQYYTGNKGGYKGQCTNQFMMEGYTPQIDCCCYRDTTAYNPSLFTCDWYCTDNTAWQGGPFQYGFETVMNGCTAKATEVCGHSPGVSSVGGTPSGFPPTCCCFNC